MGQGRWNRPCEWEQARKRRQRRVLHARLKRMDGVVFKRVDQIRAKLNSCFSTCILSIADRARHIVPLAHQTEYPNPHIIML